MWTYVIAGAVLYFVFLGDGNPVDGAVTAINELSRGSRLTHAPADAQGFVDADPEELANEAGLTEEGYSLARMIASEEPDSDTNTQAAIALCTINEARRRGTSITSLLLRAKNPKNNGYYGSQMDKDPTSSNYKGSDRYATTALDPYQREGDIAEQCLDGTISDFTGGCTGFDRAGEEKHPDRVAQSRVNSGLVEASVDGVDSGIRFWRPA